MAAKIASKLLRDLGARSSGSNGRNLELLLRQTIPFAPSSSSNNSFSSHQCGSHHAPLFHQQFSPTVAATAFGATSSSHGFLGGNVLLVGTPGMGKISGVGWDLAVGRSVAAFSRFAPPPPQKTSTNVGNSSQNSAQKPTEKKRTEEKTLASRIKDLFLALEEVPLAPLGLGLAGAIPFVGLTPGIASLLPLPDTLSAMHIEAQAAYGAVILTFLGGPHWGLAMAGTNWSQTSKVSKPTINNVRYIWSVVPSLVAWPALLLSPVPKLAVLASSFVVVLGVDAAFARFGLLPSWYMPLRYLLTGIATLSLTSSLIVAAAGSVIHH
ncbi:unnamed protein product [Calypogeia fissa]